MPYGLSAPVLDAIRGVFTKTKKLRRVRIFGSRALGTYRKGSDIDLAIEGDNLNLDDLLSIRLKLGDLFLPYTFDVVNYSELLDINLQSHINRVGITIFER